MTRTTRRSLFGGRFVMAPHHHSHSCYSCCKVARKLRQVTMMMMIMIAMHSTTIGRNVMAFVMVERYHHHNSVRHVTISPHSYNSNNNSNNNNNNHLFPYRRQQFRRRRRRQQHAAILFNQVDSSIMETFQPNDEKEDASASFFPTTTTFATATAGATTTTEPLLLPLTLDMTTTTDTVAAAAAAAAAAVTTITTPVLPVVVNTTNTVATTVPTTVPVVPVVVVPTYRTLLIFAMTTVLIWLSEPLLSLVDTTIIGQFASSSSTGAVVSGRSTMVAVVTQLASLGPATTYIDSLFYTTYFLSIATTNIIARNMATNNYQQLHRTVSHTMTVATILGVLCTLFTIVVGVPFLLPYMVGPSVSSSTATILLYARRYVYIRASVAIASIVSITSQSILLATKDTRTPAIAVVATSLTNIVGDILWRHYGVQGAAVATALATIVSCTILLHAVYQQYTHWKQLAAVDTVTTTVNQLQYPALSSSSATLRLQRWFRTLILPGKSVLSMLSIPDKESIMQLVTLAGPIFFVIVAKVICYGAMTIKCTNFGVEALATHSIMMRLFFFFACFGDSLSQTAQSFLPAVLFHTPDTTRRMKSLDDEESKSSVPLKTSNVVPSDLTRMIRRLLILGAWIGLLNSQVSTLIVRRCGHFVTKDIAITTLMKQHSNFMGLSLLVHPFIMLLEGIVLANRDYRTLLFTYATTMIMHFTMLSNFSHSFPAVWRTFFIFQCTRLSLFAYRVFKWWWSTWSTTSLQSSFESNDAIESI